MRKVIDIKKIKISSINKKYTLARNSRGRKQFCTTDEYKAFKSLIANVCLKMIFLPPYKVMIEIDNYGDIDNCVKAILDSMQGVCITNDCHVLKLLIIKNPIKRGQLGSVKVWVGTLRK
jgi:Holliday junction resolvase RusA-like endonuclease